jgi:hypothetical protein
MPRLTNRSSLNPGAAPAVPPWTWIDPRTLQAWLRVSLQSATNWRHRGTGPAWREDRSGYIWYQAASVAFWLEGEGSPSPTSRIVSYIQANEHAIGTALWTLPTTVQISALQSLLRVATLPSAELDALCRLIDRTAYSATPPRRPKLPFVAPRPPIGYTSEGTQHAARL